MEVNSNTSEFMLRVIEFVYNPWKRRAVF